MDSIFENFIISTHIPKTAGTTLARIFSACLKRRVIFDYDGYSGSTAALDLIEENRRFVCEYFRVLHGHFFARKYFDIFPDSKHIAAVRHPVDRVISQYKHELNETSSDAWYHDEIASGRMDLVTFASQPGIGNAMSIHLAGRPLSQYDLILVSEQLRLSLALFETLVEPLNIEQHFGAPASLPVENFSGKRKISPEISEAARVAVFDKTSEDNEIYSEAVSLLDQKVKTALK